MLSKHIELAACAAWYLLPSCLKYQTLKEGRNPCLSQEFTFRPLCPAHIPKSCVTVFLTTGFLRGKETPRYTRGLFKARKFMTCSGCPNF